MRVFVVNQWLPPDPAPTSVLAGEVAEALRAVGHEVVYVSRVRGDALPMPDGVERIVIDHLPTGPTGLLAKLASWPRFAWSLRAALRSRLRAGDCVLVCSDPPLAWPVAVAAARRRGARAVHWSQDLYPEVLAAHWPWTRWLLRPLRAWRDRWLRKADGVVAISEGMGARLRSGGARVRVIPNWARDERLQPRAPGDSALRRAHFGDDEFVLMYSGNLGRVHEFDTLVHAAELLRNERHVRFLVVGSGPRLAELQNAVAARGLSSFTFLPPQPGEQLVDTLAAADAHFVSLRPEFEGLVLPSKIYGVASVARPTIFCGASGGEVASLIARYGIGFALASGDAENLAALIRWWAVVPKECHEIGKRGRAWIDQIASRSQAICAWREVLSESLNEELSVR